MAVKSSWRAGLAHLSAVCGCSSPQSAWLWVSGSSCEGLKPFEAQGCVNLPKVHVHGSQGILVKTPHSPREAPGPISMIID